MGFGFGLARQQGNLLSAEAKAYKTRVLSDSGTVTNITKVNTRIALLKSLGLYTDGLLYLDENTGYKQATGIAKAYNLFGTIDFSQATESKQPTLTTDGIDLERDGVQQLDADNDVMSVACNGASALSFSFWCKPESMATGTDRNTVIAIPVSTSLAGYSLSIYDNDLQCGARSVSTDAAQYGASTGDDVDINGWQHFVCVVSYATDKIIIYKNGELLCSTDVSFGNDAITKGDTSGHHAVIGYTIATTAGRAFDGYLNELLLVKKAMSADDALAIYEATKSKYVTELSCFLVAGQSNADGRVAIASGDTWVQDGIIDGLKLWNGSAILDTYDLSNIGQSGNGASWIEADSSDKFSFADVALYNICQNLSNVICCRVTEGGSVLDAVVDVDGSWTTDNVTDISPTIRLLPALKARYDALVAYCDSVNITLNLKGLIWHQGEADYQAGEASIAAYADNWSDFIAEIRSHVGIVDLPVFYGTISHNSIYYDATIEAAQLAFAASDDNAYCRDNSALTLVDTAHFDAASCKVFGEWVAETYLENY